MSKTLTFYKNNATSYIKESFEFDMSVFHSYLEKTISHLDEYSPMILDVGFGSGRDMLYLKNNNHCVVGIDSCQEFIDNGIKEGLEVYQGTLPDMSAIPKEYIFDLIYSVGLIFHLNKEDRLELFSNIKRHLSTGGMLVLSYNTLERSSDTDREFFTVTEEMINEEVGLTLVEKEIMIDAKRGFEWVTSTYVK